MNFFKSILTLTVPLVICSNAANAVIIDKQDRSDHTFNVHVYYVPNPTAGKLCRDQSNKQEVFVVKDMPNHKIELDATLGSTNLKGRAYCLSAWYDIAWHGDSKVFALTPDCKITLTTPKDQDMSYSSCTTY